MYDIFYELKAAASKGLGVGGILTITISLLYRVLKSTVSTIFLYILSILDNSIVDLESMDVEPTKRVYENLFVPMSGNEKELRRMKFKKSANSKRFDHEKYKSHVNGKTWNADFRRKKMKECDQKIKKFSKFQPHVGMEDISFEFLRAQARQMGGPLPDHLWSKIEGVALLAAALSECRSYTQALSIFMLYLKTHYDEALVAKAADIFEELFANKFSEEECNDILSEPHSGLEKPEWISILRDGMTNWRLATSNPVFKKISYLISICITLGLCDAASFEWHVGSVKAFAIPALEKHFGAVDLIDAAIETVMYFVEGGYACFQSGSIVPLLYSDHQAREFDEVFGFLQSNIEHVQTGNLRKFTNVDENEFDLKLTKAIDLAKSLHTTAKGTWEKKIFSDRLNVLRKMKSSLDATRVQGGLRIAPFTLNIFGKSGVGKSSVSAIAMVHGLLANGFSADDEMMATLNDADKYMSNYRTFINGIFMDDVNNTKADFVEGAPSNSIVEISNNVRQYANMAEAELKGKVSIEPKFFIMTTNVKNLGATTYSNEPVSITRRAHLTITVKVKKEFCSAGMKGSVGQQLDSEKVARFYTNEDGVVEIPLVPDLWDLTIEKVIPISQDAGVDQTGYEKVVFESKVLENVSIHTFLRYMIECSRKHFTQQERLVSQSNNMAARIEMCECGTPKDYCKCIQPHAGIVGMVFGAALGQVTARVANTCAHVLTREGNLLERMATNKLLEFAENLETCVYYQWTNWVPISWLTHSYGKRFVEYAMRDKIAHSVRQEVISGCCLSLLLLALSVFVTPLFLLGVLYVLYRTAVVVRTVRERVYTEIVCRNDSMPTVFKKVRDNHVRYVLGALGAFGALYTLLKIWQGFRNSFKETHGNLQPTSQEDVDERDAQPNVWSKAVVEDIPTNDIQKTSTIDHVLRKVHKNQVFLRISQYNGNRVSGGIFVQSNVLLMPYHMWFVDAQTKTRIQDEMRVELMRANRSTTGSVFNAYLSRNCMYRIPDTDFCVVWVPNGGSYRDICQLLPCEEVRGGLCSMIFRDGEGGTVTANANITMGMVGHSQAQFYGAEYELSIPTFAGLCMGTFVTRHKSNVIAGFHLGGRTGTQTGVLGTINQKQLTAALEKLRESPIVVLAKSEGNMETSKYGVDFLVSKDIHYKSPVNFLEEGTNFRIFGTSTGSVSPHSRVIQTIISPTVAEVCGIPQQWGPPKFKPNWKPWQQSLQYSSRPSLGLEGNLLEWAVQDYVYPLLKMVKRNDWVKESIRVLTPMQTLCGIDGRRFIDKMPVGTSIGFPLSGPKSDYMTLLDPHDYPGQQFPVELEEQFWVEVDKMKDTYRAGERAYPVFKGCLKDEPTSLEKDKVRVFQAAPVALQLLVRMYFLPIARFMSVNPLVTECAVGVNSQGPEWNQLQGHICKFGKKRIFAGDYSKYDLRMPAQVMFAAFRVMMDLAKASGNYTQDDICVMEGIATDICYPIMAYNGTLLQLIGSNPSGQNLTVYINSIVNSLLNRCGFYHIMKNNTHVHVCRAVCDEQLCFRDAVALMTYGDDVKGSVREGFDLFNHISFAEFLEERDMKFTMPDKESSPVPYMDDADADFLKRKNVWNEEVHMYFGALDEKSIFKSLHCTLKSKFLTAEEQAIENIDGALREWFAHGKETYELRRAQMAVIAERHDLVCREVSMSYEDRMTAWKDKYFTSA